MATVQVAAEPVEVERNAVLEIVRTNVDAGALIVGALDANGVLVGSIIDELGRLLPCLSQGVAFIGEVIVVNYGVPVVRVSAALISRVEGRATLRRLSGVLSAPVGDLSLRLDGGTVATLASQIVAVSGDRVIGDIDHVRHSELRALMRVGVEFSVEVSDGDTVEISHRQ